MNRILRTLKGYIWWTYERGSFHYDVMVTAILLFIFISPRFINYKDKPVETVFTPKWAVVQPDGQGGMYFDVESSAVKPEGDIEPQLERIVETIAGGDAKIIGHEEVKDRFGHPVKYRIHVKR
jgi:hypothetical protein